MDEKQLNDSLTTEQIDEFKTLKLPAFCLPLPEDPDKRMILVAQIIQAMYKEKPPVEDMKSITQIVALAYHFSICDENGTAVIKESFKDDMLEWFKNSQQCYALLTTLGVFEIVKINVDHLQGPNAPKDNLVRLKDHEEKKKKKLILPGSASWNDV